MCSPRTSNRTANHACLAPEVVTGLQTVTFAVIIYYLLCDLLLALLLPNFSSSSHITFPSIPSFKVGFKFELVTNLFYDVRQICVCYEKWHSNKHSGLQMSERMSPFHITIKPALTV